MFIPGRKVYLIYKVYSLGKTKITNRNNVSKFETINTDRHVWSDGFVIEDGFRASLLLESQNGWLESTMSIYDIILKKGDASSGGFTKLRLDTKIDLKKLFNRTECNSIIVPDKAQSLDSSRINPHQLE